MKSYNDLALSKILPIIQKLSFLYQVSWIRGDRTQILAAGSYTYISDNRYTALHVSEEDTWTLVIRNVSVQDNGVFECQV